MTDLESEVISVFKKARDGRFFQDETQDLESAREMIALIKGKTDCPKCRRLKETIKGKLSEIEGTAASFRRFLKDEYGDTKDD